MLIKRKLETEWERIYKTKGGYHKNLDPKWSYYPIYLEKLKFLDRFLPSKRNNRILDAGSGEGDIVERYLKKGYDIRGIDFSYSSMLVKKGDITKLPYKDESFDVVLCLDVLQYLPFKSQEDALKEIKRVLKKEGMVIFSLPNLDHFASKVCYFFTRKYIPTDSKTRPVGDRPIREYVSLIKNSFVIKKRKSVFPTNFIVSAFLIKSYPKEFLWLFKIINLFAYPDWCFVNFFLCRKINHKAQT